MYANAFFRRVFFSSFRSFVHDYYFEFTIATRLNRRAWIILPHRMALLLLLKMRLFTAISIRNSTLWLCVRHSLFSNSYSTIISTQWLLVRGCIQFLQSSAPIYRLNNNNLQFSNFLFIMSSINMHGIRFFSMDAFFHHHFFCIFFWYFSF